MLSCVRHPRLTLCYVKKKEKKEGYVGKAVLQEFSLPTGVEVDGGGVSAVMCEISETDLVLCQKKKKKKRDMLERQSSKSFPFLLGLRWMEEE